MKFKNVTLALVIALAVSCGSKETKEETLATDTTATETPAAPAAPATVKEMVAKEWVVDNINYNLGLNAAQDKAKYKSDMDKIVAEMKGKPLNLNADGKATMEVFDFTMKVKQYSGTWALADEDKTLKVTAERPDPFEWTIFELTPDKMVLLMENTSVTYIPKK